MSGSVKRILVVTGDHNLEDTSKPGGHYNPEDLEAHAVTVAAFRSLSGFDFDFCTDHSELLDGLRTSPPDLVVNFCDTGYRNKVAQELNLPAYLEMLDIPYTGAPPAAMVLCYDKAVVRMVADSLGVPVPRETYFPADADLARMPDAWPALIKPNAADGSLGITKDAVVRTRNEAVAYMTWLRKTLPGRDALIQEYLPGTEYGIGIVGNPAAGFHVLPPLEVDYSGLPNGLNPILSYESKSLPDSPYWTEIKFRRTDLAPETEARVVESCKKLFRRLSLRDYARFDFRTAVDGEPKLMEVNPNPAWEAGAKLAFMASFAGIDYPSMLKLILEAAIDRVARR